ncbi:MAG TPA: LptA/OstA family protein, partial [Candidatus Binatia bacterium]|nr:LptA/OstA family protein [Candidatus Binatia bacterium]
SQPQDFDITAPVIDFFLADGRRLDHAVTSGDAKIAILPAQNSTGESGQRTVVTAGSFLARFVETENGQSRLESMHGAPDARIVNSAPGIPDRVSTSQTVDASFLPQGGIASIIQRGNVIFTDNQTPEKRTQAWADKALYTPSDRLLVLTGKPRVLNGSMLTTAKIVRINRETDDAFAEGEVKSTYSDLKPQSDGALLASSSPIHVTAASMTAHNSPAIAVYQGNARLWQDANIIEAPTIQFDRDHRSLIAQGGPAQPVSTVLVQAKPGNSSDPGTAAPAPGKKNRAAGNSEEKRRDTDPVTITSERLTYSDNDRIAHYEGSVAAKGAAFTASSKSMDVYLVPRSQTAEKQSVAGAGRIDHMVAQGNVVIVQPRRRAVGDKLVYTASEDKFVLTGGPPSIFDAERGKITGVSLTFFRSDDRVLVEGEASTPVVTQTRVAR